jgi:[ribosomal protein S5]-alanine N-acetyltransferase
MTPSLRTERLELRPLPPAVAAVLPGDRAAAEALLAARLPTDWPQEDLLDVLPLQAKSDGRAAEFGVWVIIERASQTVVGDAGFRGPPADGAVEVGYSVIPDRRRRGYASEAAAALVDWARSQHDVEAVVAACDRETLASIRTLERLGFARTGVDGEQIRSRRASSE